MASLCAFFAAAATALLITPTALAVGGGSFTTNNPGVDGLGHCQNGPPDATTPAINCNIYDGKEFVWINGGPDANHLTPDGYYFFAVLSPGGQPTPNDGTAPLPSPLGTPDRGTPKNLSDDWDNYTNRTFVTSGGEVSTYLGSHWLDSGACDVDTSSDPPLVTCPRLGAAPDGLPPYLRLFPYSDTLNQGGVYILAICFLGPDKDHLTYPVRPRDCKYDAFKIKAGESTPPAADLGVDKDAKPEFKRQFAWDIAKGVDKTIVRQVAGTATFTYTVTVFPTGHTDKDWTVTGTIDVFNPNSFAVSGVNINDKIIYDDDNDPGTDPVTDTNATCDVTNGTNQTVPANDAIHRAYTCTYSAPGPKATNETNRVDVTWSPTGDMAGTSGATFWEEAFSWPSSPTQLVDECVNVTDAVDGGSAGALGSVCVDEDGHVLAPTGVGSGVTATRKPNGGPYTSVEFVYSRSFAVPRFNCVIHNNTAKFTTTDTGANDTASQSVQACGPADTGALTMGFWKGPNGQNLIKNYCTPSGKTSLATYLSTLPGAVGGPFQAAAGKSCTDLATYVSGILNAASATDMNKMLKAQMLATALDVYFSGDGWSTTPVGSGKNQIKPPSGFLKQNIGAFVMDLTAICPMVDNLSTGTATCKNNTPSTDAFAAGAVPWQSRSVSDILTFAASTPPWASGDIWYSGNRTKQELLKNIFDQINNQDAFPGP